MGKIIAIVIGLFVLVMIVGRCARSDDAWDPEVEKAKFDAEAMATGFDSPTLAPRTEGEPVAVPSDPGATYRLLSWSKLASGNLQAITRRDGKSGTNFARREIDCDAMTFPYLGEGDTLEEAMKDRRDPGTMGELTDRSISTYVSQFACNKASR